MKILELTETDDLQKTVQFFTDAVDIPKIEDFRGQYEVSNHPVFDTHKRPDKKILKEDGSFDRWESVNRLGMPIQKKIVGASVSFLFGNAVNLVAQTKSDQETAVLDAIKKVLSQNKIDSFNRKVARDLFRSTQVAEVWFVVDGKEKNNDYGFDTYSRIKVLKLSPWDGDELFPFFDKYGDMVAFCRGFTRREDKKDVKYFAIYTDEEYQLLKYQGQDWQQEDYAVNVLNKIPVVFAQEEHADWADVQTTIERLEHLLSNFADTNDYHGNPKIFIEGEIEGFVKKGETGAIIQGEKGAKASYLSWDHAPESIKLEIETLFKVIYSFTQTPDISFDSLKDLKQGISGVALEMLFMDAHLKVQEKREIFDEYLQRRINIIKAFLGQLKPDWKAVLNSLDIKSEITPYMINDLGALVKNLVEANGGKSILSQKTAIEKSGLVGNSADELAQIQKEDKEAKMMDLGDSVI